MFNSIFKLLIILNSMALTSITVHSKEICPRVCICDVFEGLKRADCSDQRLVSADINLAKTVEILNLSGNDITTVEHQNFKDFSDLIDLSLAKNSIHTIELFSFSNLKNLKHLDLSENRLESLDNRIIENNEKLTFLDLSKNKFMMLDDDPLLISDSLEFLSLRGSHLSHIYDSFFTDVPKVVDLDISDNLLMTLKITNLAPLQKLQFLNIEYNSFTCDTSFEQTLQNLKHRKVFVKTDKCNKHSKKPMFEKMIMLENPQKEDVEIDLVWGENSDVTTIRNASFPSSKSSAQEIIDYYKELESNREEEIDCLNDEFMSSLCECRQNFMSLYELHASQLKAMEYRLYAVLYVGVFIGAVTGCLLFYIISFVKKKCSNAITMQVRRQQMRDQIVRNYVENVKLRRLNNEDNQPLVAAMSQNNHVERNEQQQQQQSERITVVPSSTAQLLQRLFRDRDVSEAPVAIPFMNPIPVERFLENNTNVDASDQHSQYDNDGPSEHASVVSQASTMNIDRSCTPPPPYRDVFD